MGWIENPLPGHHVYEHDMPDGRRCFVYPLLMGTWRLGIGAPRSSFMDDQW